MRLGSKALARASLVVALASCAGAAPQATREAARETSPVIAAASLPEVALEAEPPPHEPAPLSVAGLSDDEPFMALPVPHHRDAVLSVPLGATGPRPVIVASHGAGGRPEAHCALWRRLVRSGAFVLCPRGVTLNAQLPPEQAGYFFDGHPRLAREIDAALEALIARFGDRVDASAALYAGFSQGATMGALALPLVRGRFARAVLIEGGDAEWSRYSARQFAKSGGRRVLILCGRLPCATNARRSAGYLTREGVEARAIHVAGAGHTYGGPVEAELVSALPWLLGGDARWEAALEALRARE